MFYVTLKVLVFSYNLYIQLQLDWVGTINFGHGLDNEYIALQSSLSMKNQVLAVKVNIDTLGVKYSIGTLNIMCRGEMQFKSWLDLTAC